MRMIKYKIRCADCKEEFDEEKAEVMRSLGNREKFLCCHVCGESENWEIVLLKGDKHENNDCPNCDGRGVVLYEDGCHVHEDECWVCNGSGQKKKSKNVFKQSG